MASIQWSERQETEPAALAEVARRFLWTEAGAEALELLAVRQLNGELPAAAAASFQRLLQRQPADRLSEETLYLAARSFRLAGNQNELEKTWKLLANRLGDRQLSVAGRTQSLGRWREEMEQEAGRPRQPPKEAAVPRGNLGHTGELIVGAPFPVAKWRHQTTMNPIVSQMLAQAVKSHESGGGTVLPAAAPILARARLVFRTTSALVALDPDTGSMVWHTADQSRLSFDCLVSERIRWAPVQQWCKDYERAGKANVLLENATIGMLSGDDKCVYAIDDLPVPPFPLGDDKPPDVRGAFSQALWTNRLQGYLAANGKLMFELGYSGDPKQPVAVDLSQSCFLGPPLPLGRMLYVLNEKDQAIRLVAIEVERQFGPVWCQALAVMPSKLLADPGRRIAGTSPAYAEGILVCPTNAGHVSAIPAGPSNWPNGRSNWRQTMETSTTRWAWPTTGPVTGRQLSTPWRGR